MTNKSHDKKLVDLLVGEQESKQLKKQINNYEIY